MSLANWANYAVGLNGKPQRPIFTSKLGVRVVIVKNTVYITGTRGVNTTRTSVRMKHYPSIEVYRGSVYYEDVSVIVTRGPQDGAFVACWGCPDHDIEHCVGMVACGVYGYDDHTSGDPWVGVEEDTLSFFRKWISTTQGAMSTREEIEAATTKWKRENPEGDAEAFAVSSRHLELYDFPIFIAEVELPYVEINEDCGGLI